MESITPYVAQEPQPAGGAWSGIPVWVRAIFLVGAPVVWMSYMLYTTQSGIVPAMLEQNKALVKVTEQLILISKDHAELRAQGERSLSVLRLTCVSLAKTDAVKAECQR